MSEKLLKNVADAVFVAAFAALVYGLHLWATPLPWIVGGLLAMAGAVFVSYSGKSDRGRRK